eukprot:TRINITY_DN35541_c0_g1_i1.p1 TRINITY_DN35541_c0_g1~~TRINITY_DN35541_c0_g1_i1.p1  ORF type:complete len:948 (+),score=121.11 TRINITY_DN35541_c0_g1_i1:223-3066(+)
MAALCQHCGHPPFSKTPSIPIVPPVAAVPTSTSTYYVNTSLNPPKVFHPSELAHRCGLKRASPQARFGLDIGGTLCKLVVFEPLAHLPACSAEQKEWIFVERTSGNDGRNPGISAPSPYVSAPPNRQHDLVKQGASVPKERASDSSRLSTENRPNTHPSSASEAQSSERTQDTPASGFSSPSRPIHKDCKPGREATLAPVALTSRNVYVSRNRSAAETPCEGSNRTSEPIAALSQNGRCQGVHRPEMAIRDQPSIQLSSDTRGSGENTGSIPSGDARCRSRPTIGRCLKCEEEGAGEPAMPSGEDTALPLGGGEEDGASLGDNGGGGSSLGESSRSRARRIWRSSHRPILLPGRGTFIFKRFETWQLEDFLKLNGEHTLMISGTKGVGVTGGGSKRFGHLLKDKAGLTLHHADELTCLVRGIDFLARYARQDCFLHPQGTYEAQGSASIQRPLRTEASCSSDEGEEVNSTSSDESAPSSPSKPGVVPPVTVKSSTRVDRERSGDQPLRSSESRVDEAAGNDCGRCTYESEGGCKEGKRCEGRIERAGGAEKRASDHEEALKHVKEGTEGVIGRDGGLWPFVLGHGVSSAVRDNYSACEGIREREGDEASVTASHEEWRVTDDGTGSSVCRRNPDKEGMFPLKLDGKGERCAEDRSEVEMEREGEEGDDEEHEEWEEMSESFQRHEEARELKHERVPGMDGPRKVEAEDEDRESIYPYLVVNIGSGVSILLVESADNFKRVGGTSLGGSTFLGLTAALTGCNGFKEAIRMASRGDSTKVDMLVGDIYGGDYDRMGLKATTVASSFGKLVRPGVMMTGAPLKSTCQAADCEREASSSPLEEEGFSGPSADDMAKAALLMVTNNVGSLAMLHARPAGVRNILFAGSFLDGNKVAMRLLSVAVDFWSKGEMRAVFLRHEGHAGAIGALLGSLDANDAIDTLLLNDAPLVGA